MMKDVFGGMLAFVAAVPSVFAASALFELAGWSSTAVFTGLCLSSGATTLVASRWLRMPVIVTPSLGLISLFIFSMVFGTGLSRESVLMTFCLSGVVILMLSVFRGGTAIVKVIPSCFYPAVMGGIGLLLIGTGFREAGILVDHPVSLVVIGNLTARGPVVVGISVLAACIGMARGYHHGLLICGVTALLAGTMLGIIPFTDTLMNPMWRLTAPTFIASSDIFDFDSLRFLPSILLIIILETAGVFVALQAILERDAERSGYDTQPVWWCIGTAGALSPVLGVPGPFLSPEGLVGGIAGGKTWITGLTTGCLFLVSPLLPVFARIFGQGYQVGPDQWLYPLAAPLLITGGLACLSGLRRIEWSRPEAFIPTGIICAVIPLSFSVVNGLGLGLLAYTAIRAAQGQIRDLHPLYLIIIPLLVLRYLML